MIWEKWQAMLEPLRAALNAALGKTWEEWEIPREADAELVRRRPPRRSRQHGGKPASPARREIDASIAARADVEYLYDQPYVDNARVRVAGPFTVESLRRTALCRPTRTN